MELVQVGGLFRYPFQQLGHLILDIRPPRREQVHLNDCITVIVIGTCGHEPAALFGLGSLVGEAIGRRPNVSALFGWVVCVGLSVRDVAVVDVVSWRLCWVGAGGFTGLFGPST